MENYLDAVQNVVMIGEGEYRVTFRASNKTESISGRVSEEQEPYSVYSMIARCENADYRFIAEGDLGECVSIYDDHRSAETVEKNDMDKWQIGDLANGILVSLVDREMLTPYPIEDD
ncbi:MAG TPA: hypothetical protein VIS48_16915 [Candidatus Kryptonia bacterium]